MIPILSNNFKYNKKVQQNKEIDCCLFRKDSFYYIEQMEAYSKNDKILLEFKTLWKTCKLDEKLTS